MAAKEYIELIEDNLCHLEKSIKTAFVTLGFTITINNRDVAPSLRIYFEDNYFYEFGLLDKLVDWRNLDARDWNRQQTVIYLVDAWAKNVFNDGWRRAACAAFANMIYEDLIKIAYRPERVFTCDFEYEL
jgi:hypothetical protein